MYNHDEPIYYNNNAYIPSCATVTALCTRADGYLLMPSVDVPNTAIE